MKPFIPTKEAIKLLGVGHDKFNDIRKKFHIEPLYRGGQGNMYAVKDLMNLSEPTRQESPFDRC